MAGGRTGLTKTAKALFRLDMRGVKNELAEIMEEAKTRTDMSREEMGALSLRKQICEVATRMIREEVGDNQHDELAEQLRDVADAMRVKQSGGSSFTSDQISGLGGTSPRTTA